MRRIRTMFNLGTLKRRLLVTAVPYFPMQTRPYIENKMIVAVGACLTYMW